MRRMGERRYRLAAIVLLALVLRLAPVLAPLDWSAPDSETYDAPARSLVEKHAYLDAEGRETAERPPGYPAFLALVYSCHDSRRAVGVAQALLGAATVLLLERLIRRRKPEAALGAAFLLAIDPIAIGLVPYVLREALLLFLLTALLLALDSLEGLARGIVSGLLLAALALTHQLYVPLGIFLIVASRLAKGRVRPLLLSLVLVGLGVLGWTLRNQEVGSKQLMLTSYPVPAGELWLVTESTNEWLHDDPTTAFQALHFQEIARLQSNSPNDIGPVKRELYARAWSNFKERPLTVLGRALRINVWYWLEVPGSVRLTLDPRLWVLRVVLIPFHWLRLFWAIVAIRELRKRNELGRFANELATWAFLAIVPAPILPIPRYLAPLTGVLDGFAVVGWVLYRQRTLTLPATEVDSTLPPSAPLPPPTLNKS